MRVNLEARAAAAENRKAQTRERLLDAAIVVIGDKGPDASSVEDFVAAADVSRGTFYNYFPTMEDLLRAVRRKLTDALMAVLDAHLPSSIPASSRLATRLHSHFALVSHDPAWGWVVMRLDATRLGRTPAMEESFDRMYREGVAAGEFRPADPLAVRSLTFGTSRMVQRDILLGLATPEHKERVVALLLVTFGLTPEDAERISRESALRAAQIQDQVPLSAI
ncbi:TetR/AcrR family transcriptional regulator [Phenylobacterium sp.]|uniref:TetR/AcrR family transcriptional regulator n=1 Tax=Phenylobacterium sp. TaxID=1871053 RepID=UPI002731154F|nr:TetR/AcrR family transcriptional regulator [Phenylobacterium sp.]MDP1600922.1 helix-turn-helix domain-containing protein [Phenylobacterium sp.]MDP3594111.1 helix-turn-helix domain-containing protein [Phenylobacterium sp.]